MNIERNIANAATAAVATFEDPSDKTRAGMPACSPRRSSSVSDSSPRATASVGSSRPNKGVGKSAFFCGTRMPQATTLVG